MRFINVYAFTGAENKEFRAADATASLMRAIEREVISTPDLPTVIVGDLNVEADRSPYVSSLLESGSHFDACLPLRGLLHLDHLQMLLSERQTVGGH